MDVLIRITTFLALHWQEILTSFIAVLLALIALFHAMIVIALVIPGEQPEKFLQSCLDIFQKIVDFLTTFSKK